MKDFFSPVFFSLGIVAGLAFALGLMFLWAAIAGPAQEYILENTLDRWHRKREGKIGQPESAVDGKISLLVSDLHIDTWDFVDGNRPSAFNGFLEWARKNPKVTDLYINGDILDLPPHPLNQRDVPTLTVKPLDSVAYPDLELGELGVLQDTLEPVLELVGKLLQRDDDLPPLNVTYLTGNHDIGVAGLRYVRPKLAWTSFRVVWNPAVCVEIAAGRWIYLEHGHRYDPFLWIYLRYAVLELLRGPGTAVAQRRGKSGMNAQVSNPNAKVMVWKPKHEWEQPDTDLQPIAGESITTKLARYRFRQGARKLYRELAENRSEIKVVTFGHTHIPDRYEFPGGRIYINSGDWAGNSPHQCFLIFHPSGKVSGPHQWRGADDANRIVETAG